MRNRGDNKRKRTHDLKIKYSKKSIKYFLSSHGIGLSRIYKRENLLLQNIKIGVRIASSTVAFTNLQ